jgi:hypothetical protein
MHIQRALALSFLTAALLCFAAIPGAAQPTAAPTASPGGAMAPMMHAAPPASSLVSVSDCHASLNIQQSGGYAAYPVGYRGGYWGDPWGVNYYQPPVTTTSPQLAIHYKNISTKVMSDIQFGLVANGILKAEVKDVGKFSPGAEIKHKFGIPASTFPISTGLPQCVPLHITFADGTKWRNPQLPPKNTHIYLHP